MKLKPDGVMDVADSDFREVCRMPLLKDLGIQDEDIEWMNDCTMGLGNIVYHLVVRVRWYCMALRRVKELGLQDV